MRRNGSVGSFGANEKHRVAFQSIRDIDQTSNFEMRMAGRNQRDLPFRKEEELARREIIRKGY